ncbi:MAG: peptidoglycan-associated lipoprotein Pal [Pseudoxanthomonas sp.]
MNTTTRVVMLSLLSVAVLAGCKKTVKDTLPADTGNTGNTGVVTDGTTTAGAYGPNDLDTDACLRQRVVYFDLDQDALKPEFQAIVGCHAKYLRDRPSSRINLEGNADERGSRAYNQGLGERRGNAVSSALQAQGGSGSQVSVISYGEERPICTDSNEDCWARNRRVEIVYTAK